MSVRSRALVASMALSTLALATSCEPGPEDGEPAPAPTLGRLKLPIFNGTADTSAAHQAVVAVMDNAQGGLCTGTLITPTVVLTAAHCVDGGRASDFYVGIGNDIDSSSMQWLTVSELKPHASYDDNEMTNDIALIKLRSAAPSTVVPIPHLPASLAMTSADLGASLLFVGYGRTERNTTGVKLKATDALEMICTAVNGCTYKSQYPIARNTIVYDQQPGGPCQGDSGGPAFLTRNGKEYVVGVTSYGDQPCTAYGVSTKVDAFEAWINAYIGVALKANGATCAAGSECQSTFCVDGVCCNAACAGGACDACSVATGATANGTCTARPGSCDDGLRCTSNDTCQAGACVGTAVTCPGTDACRWASMCNPNTGSCDAGSLKPDGTACDDGNGCTANDSCQQGTCRGTQQSVCPAPDACHEASACNPTTGQCAPYPVKADGTACSDNNACTQGDSCRSGVCTGTATVCPAGPCAAAACNPLTGACEPGAAKPDGTTCDDQNACTTNDRCTRGACQGSLTQTTCPAPDSCHDAGVCNASTGQCVAAPKADGTACEDGDPCTRGDACRSGVCTPGTKASCVAPDPCREAVGCDWQTGGCLFRVKPNGSECDDQNPCTQHDGCFSGMCVGATLQCEAKDECHAAGVCDPGTGECTNPKVDDGTGCEGGTCKAGKCVAAAAAPAPESSGCGCSTGGAAPAGWGLALLALAALPRRRRK